MLFASLALGLLFWPWRALHGLIWEPDSGIGRVLLTGLFSLAWSAVLLSPFTVSHCDLFGLRQVLQHLRGTPYAPQWLRDAAAVSPGASSCVPRVPARLFTKR